MFNLFNKKCQHPADRLAVAKEATIVNKDEDFNSVTYHLFCRACDERVDIKYAQVIGGAEAFLTRRPNAD